MSRSFHKNIYQVNNRWVVKKTIKGETITFKSFGSLTEAMDYKEKLIANDWNRLPEDETDLINKYFKYINLNARKNGYRIYDKHYNYLGTVKSIEKALYYRDLYSDCPSSNIPKPYDVDLVTDNPYLIDGLRYSIPEKLIFKPKTTKYGKGVIVKKSRSAYQVKYNKEHFASCRTYEQAYYVRQELQKCNWDKSKVNQILNDYPKWYTWLLRFYQYILQYKTSNSVKYSINIPQKFNKRDYGVERISGFCNLEDALFERDFLVKNNWDYELLVYSINDEDNPYYSMELPPYPERKIRNITEFKTFKEELTRLQELIEDGETDMQNCALLLDTSAQNIRNWLKKYDTTFYDFKNIVYSGEDPFTVLELKEQYYMPDLSRSKPSNFKGYIHKNDSNRSPFLVSRKGVYYGSYKDKKTAKKVVKELEKVDWDKSKLKKIQEKIGFDKFLGTKNWVYKNSQGKTWTIRKKDKNRRMINYGCYKDKRVAEFVRDLLVENDWDKSRLDEFRSLAEKYYEGE